MKDIAKGTTSERFDHLLKTISSADFLGKRGLNGEIPFYICPFKPEEFTVFTKEILSPLNRSLKQKGVNVCDISLYDLSIDLLEKRGILDTVLEEEEGLSKDELKELLQNVLDPETNIIPAIAAMLLEEDYHVLFITDVGSVFPYIRSHTILNNLQSKVKDIPTVMFFPGEYEQSNEEGATLNLFNKILDDNYYRAFNIYHQDQGEN